MSENITPNDDYHIRMSLAYGSIVSHLPEIAKDRGYINKSGGVNISRLARESGVSTATFYFLITRPSGFRQLNLITLTKLCKTLKCQPGDLFSYVGGLSTDALGIDTSFLANLKGVR